MASTDKPTTAAEPDPALVAAQAHIMELEQAISAGKAADLVLAEALTPWLGAHHIGINTKAAHDVLTWMSARGYEPSSGGDPVHDGVNVVGDSVPEAPAATA
jgi:hypothetical protein